MRFYGLAFGFRWHSELAVSCGLEPLGSVDPLCPKLIRAQGFWTWTVCFMPQQLGCSGGVYLCFWVLERFVERPAGRDFDGIGMAPLGGRHSALQ